MFHSLWKQGQYWAQCKRPGTRKRLGTAAAGTADVTVTVFTVLHFGTISCFGTIANFGVHTGILGAGNVLCEQAKRSTLQGAWPRGDQLVAVLH